MMSFEEAQGSRSFGDHAEDLSIIGSSWEGLNWFQKVLFGLVALWHVVCLELNWSDLNHNQIDILLQFWIRVEKVGLPTPSNNHLMELARREVAVASDNAIPHQLALAHLTRAEVQFAIAGSPTLVETDLERALNLESQIRNEDERELALSQLIRILRKAGELYWEMKGDKEVSRTLLLRALQLCDHAGVLTPEEKEKHSKKILQVIERITNSKQ
jgi:hypothetical protein